MNLSEIVLDITAQSGAGNLLGNLLCAVAGLLDQPGGLAKILNDILGVLAGCPASYRLAVVVGLEATGDRELT